MERKPRNELIEGFATNVFERMVVRDGFAQVAFKRREVQLDAGITHFSEVSRDLWEKRVLERSSSSFREPEVKD